MPKDGASAAAHLRNRAEEARTIADTMGDSTAADLLRKSAALLEEAAARLEKSP